LIPILGDEHVAAELRQAGEERRLGEDAHEVTTLEGGSEEWGSGKQRTEEEGEPVEQIGGDAQEKSSPKRSRRRA
jgi:hypothetical protein